MPTDEKLLSLVAGCLMLFGCASMDSGFCAMDLGAEGWRQAADSQHAHLQSWSDSKELVWYTNQGGDFLVCHTPLRGDHCGGIYELFKKQVDGSFAKQEIFCTE